MTEQETNRASIEQQNPNGALRTSEGSYQVYPAANLLEEKDEQ